MAPIAAVFPVPALICTEIEIEKITGMALAKLEIAGEFAESA